MYLSYDLKNGVEYGKLCCSHWVNGKDPISLFQNLGYQHCSLYEDKIIVHEADSKANQSYKIFQIGVPEEVRLPLGRK